MKAFTGTAALFGFFAVVSGAIAGEVSGREAFAPCRACHNLEMNSGVMAGPSLSGLIGRAVGGDPEFQYSPVLRDAKDAGLAWSGLSSGWKNFSPIRKACSRACGCLIRAFGTRMNVQL